MPGTDTNSNRIKFAWYSPEGQPDGQSVKEGRSKSTRVTIAECDVSMEGSLYCPTCFTNVFRSPREGAVFSNGRSACFAHYPRNRHVPCDLRSTKPEGKRYDSVEEARQAIAVEELVVISAFRTETPTVAGLSAGVYDQSAVEDVDGPLADVPIGRYRGDPFRLPSKLTTVSAICRNFDLNLHRYYVFPGSGIALMLTDALRSCASIEDSDETPRLYFGRIKSSHNAGRSPNNIRMTWLEHGPAVKDLCIKDTDAIQREKGIDDECKGRVVLVWGRVTESGIGLCFTRLGWGEYALLPRSYEHLLAV